MLWLIKCTTVATYKGHTATIITISIMPCKCDFLRSQGTAFASMGGENLQFLQKGSLKIFDMQQICFSYVHFKNP